MDPSRENSDLASFYMNATELEGYPEYATIDDSHIDRILNVFGLNGLDFDAPSGAVPVDLRRGADPMQVDDTGANHALELRGGAEPMQVDALPSAAPVASRAEEGSSPVRAPLTRAGVRAAAARRRAMADSDDDVPAAAPAPAPRPDEAALEGNVP